MSSSTAATMNPLAGVEATLGPALVKKIQESKILLVGAGGIGCELLKNLSLSGFRHVEAIDLDTIDVSNLNRQFLFRSHHVGQPKCVVACQVAKEMILTEESSVYQAHHGNVCDNSKFNVQWVSQFDVVLNALDNVTARRRVNRLCLAANVPLVEAGTTGYLGQVKVIDKASGVACYECKTQEAPTVYPICTIRSTPSMPVHTIVFAKELYKLLFGEKVEESMLHEDAQGNPTANDDTTAEEEPPGEPSTYMASVLHYRSLLQKKETDKDAYYKAATDVLTNLYIDEIEKQLSMDRYKTAKKTPTSLNKDDIQTHSQATVTPPTQKSTYTSTDVWSIQECLAEFTSCLVDAATHESLLPEFDKDDVMAMRFVTAASNLRSYVFQITPIQSYYSCKGIAGAIIPAIATTNAIVAGLQILQVFHILQAQLEQKVDALKERCRYVDVTRHKTGRSGFYISASTLDEPNPKCFVCRNATINLTLNVEEWTLEKLLSLVIQNELGFQEPTILVEGDVIYEQGDGADTALFEGNLQKVLTKLPCGGVQHGTVFRVEDFTQDLEVDVCVHHQSVWERKEGEDKSSDADKYLVGGEKPQAKDAPPPAAAASMENGVAKMPEATPDEEDDDDEIEIIETEPDAKMPAKDSKVASLKRASPIEASGGPIKKRKVEENGDHEVIEID